MPMLLACPAATWVVRAVVCTLCVLTTAGCCPPPGPRVSSLLVDQACFVHNDYQDLPRPRSSAPRSAYREEFREILSGFLVGTGDRLAHDMEGSGRVEPLYEWSQKHGAPVNTHAIWLTREFEADWATREDLDAMVEAGVIPVLILYYFAGDISRRYVMENRQEWYLYLMKVAAIAAIDYPVLVVIEPEFNDETNEEGTLILSWPGFNEVIIDGIYLLRSLAPNVLVGICPGDFGDQDLEPSIGEVVEYSDFIAFQQMRGSTRDSDMSHDKEDITGRSIAYTHYLNETFDKPVLLAYWAVSTYDSSGDWAQYQADVAWNLFDAIPRLRESGLFGMLYFMLVDDPEHEGYFDEAEKFFGLVDSYGQPKPGWYAFQKRCASSVDILTRPGR